MCDHCSQMCKEVFKCDFQSEFEHIRPSDEQETGYGTHFEKAILRVDGGTSRHRDAVMSPPDEDDEAETHRGA